MDFIDEVKAKDDVMSEEKQKDIFFTLLNGKDVTEEIETSRGKFTVRFPKQKDLIAIERRIAYMRGGIAASCFSESANYALEKVAYLDICVIGGDAWFENLKKKDSFSWGDMPDTNFVDEVFVKAWTFRAKVQADFASNERKADTAASDESDVSEDVDNGLFSGVAASAKRN